MAEPVTVFDFPLLDGALARPAPAAADAFTAAKIETMAKDLIRYRAFNDERAAIRTLSGLGHAQGEIIRLVDRALARAKELAR
ncbi:hypothetical protein [Bradyrhizobium sp. SZCCHNR2032]|uniref:hypothetical protein n=1 Tax=Bradyrhizobium sp. SZCCHNR2032 TaxID=3057384 RepID=UPI00291689EC|nr:hypothetical protein [Bradyrhizobium sp. SZCCHNR2032]